MFRKAERKKSKLRLGLLGPSGSGKTYSALLIAKGIGGKVAMLDTERGSGELYSHLMDYDVATLTAPFSPHRYVEIIKEAERAGYNVLIIDSLSHAWQGEGGVLDMHDKANTALRNSFTAWREVTPQHNALVDAMLQSPLHIIATMRSKTAYEITNETGKTKVTKVGLAPVQREGMEYEFTVVFEMSVDGHIATATKDRTSLFDGKHFTPDESTGAELLKWLEGGAETVVETKNNYFVQSINEEKSREHFKSITNEMSKLNSLEELKSWWDEHTEEIKRLSPKHKEQVVRFKDNLKVILKGSGSEDGRKPKENQMTA